jgi:hypothetical protein
MKKINPRRQSFLGSYCLIILGLFLISGFTYGQKSVTTEKRISELEGQINTLTDKVRLLEAIVAELQQKYPPGSIQALQQLLIERNKNGILNELNNIASSAYQYRIRPATMGGGGGSYEGFKIPSKLVVTEFAAYSINLIPNRDINVNNDQIILIAKSVFGLGTITVHLGSDGKLTNFIYSGEFE